MPNDLFEATDDWRDAMIATLLVEGEAAAEQLQREARRLRDAPVPRGIVNLLLDRAADLQRPQGDA